jgi:tetratricopeptide (TPR) repeat protein
VLGALQQIAPQLILLDDVQWADPAFWPVLDGLRDSLSRQRILLVMSGRRGELAAQAPAWELLQHWDRSGSATVLPLAGLDEETLAPLLHRRMSGPATPERIHAIWEASGGNPLLALGLAATDEAELAVTVRPSLALLALRRFARLSPAAQAALEAAACLGTSFRYLHWEAMWRCAGYPEEQLPLLAGELERAQQLLLAGDAYRFAHDTLRSAVYQQTDALQRHRWHRHALAALEADHAADLPALFHHAHRADIAAGIVRYGRQAGQQALAGFSFQSAGAYFSAALAALPALDAETDAERRRLEAELLTGRAQAYRVLGQRAAELADLQSLQTIADELADGRLQALYRYHRADYAWSIGELAAALAFAGEGHALAQTLDDLRLQAMFYEIMGRIEREMKVTDHARRHIEQMQQIYATLGDAWGEALALDLLGGLGWDQGDYQTAMTGHRAAAELFRSSGDILREAQSLNNLGSTYWALGDYAGARAVHTRSLAVCRQMGNRRGEADNVDNLGGVAWVLGDYDAAIHLYDAALRIRRAIDDQWGVAISLANLGSAYREQGAPAEALDYYAQAYPLYQAVGRRRGEGYVLHARGLALLELARAAEARDALLAALAVRREIGSRFATVESLAALALAHLATGELPAALAAQRSALAGLDPEHDSASLQQQVHWASYQVALAAGEKARGLLHLARAEAAMQRVAATLAPQECATFLENVPLNRQVVAAVAGETVTASVQVAASDAPVGRPVRSGEYRTVRWTVTQPGDLLIAEGAARRSHILLRLAREAEAQGGAPTDADLAAALGVSRRTILRDIAQLAETGIPLRTRSRR